MRVMAIAGVSLALAGCMQVTADGNMAPPQEPVSVRTISGDYQRFAACAYLRLEEGTTGVHKVDLAGAQTTRIYLQQNTGVLYSMEARFWDMTIRQTAPDQVQVSIRAPHTIWGHDRWAVTLWEKMGPCEAEARSPAPQPRRG